MSSSPRPVVDGHESRPKSGPSWTLSTWSVAISSWPPVVSAVVVAAMLWLTALVMVMAVHQGRGVTVGALALVGATMLCAAALVLREPQLWGASAEASQVTPDGAAARAPRPWRPVVAVAFLLAAGLGALTTAVAVHLVW